MENIQYYEHTCACGCNGKIEIRRWHKHRGIPKYVHGHHKGNLNKVRNEDQRLRMSEAQKNRFQKEIIWNKGKSNIYDENTLKNLSEKIKELWKNEDYRKKNKTNTGNKGIITWNKGLTKELDIRIKLFSEKMKGVNSPNWNNGSSFEPYSPEFNKDLKSFIKNRDLHTCQNLNCCKKPKILTIHHIDHDKKNNNPKNLITLCFSCNSKANFNRQYWVSYYQNIMENKINV